MRKVKNIVIVTVAILCVLAIVIGIILSKNWTIRFHSELNRFSERETGNVSTRRQRRV